MKKFVCALVAMMMMLSMAASAAVVSKTTTDTTVVEKIETSTGVEVKETFEVKVAENTEPVVQQITNLFKFVVEEEQAPIAYFPPETQEQVKAVVAAKIEQLPELEKVEIDVEKMEINEFVTIETINYEETYGDVAINFSFLTEYKVGQVVVALVSIFTGEYDELGNPIVEWIIMDAEVMEDGTLTVIFPQVEMTKVQEAENVALAILSEAVETEETAEAQN